MATSRTSRNYETTAPSQLSTISNNPPSRLSNNINAKSGSRNAAKKRAHTVDVFAEDFVPYRPPLEEDIYLPPGRKRHDREELIPSEDKYQLGPRAVDNDDIFRQKFAIKDYLKTLRTTLM